MFLTALRISSFFSVLSHFSDTSTEMSSVSCIQSPPTDFLQRLVFSRYISVAASSLHLLLILCQGCVQAFTIPHSPFVEVSRTRVTTKRPPLHVPHSSQVTQRGSAVPPLWGWRWMQKPQWKAAFNVLSRCVWVPSKCSFFRDIGRGPQSDSQACSNIFCPFLFFVQRGPTQRRSLETCGSGPRSPCCLRRVLMTPLIQNPGANLASMRRFSRVCCHRGSLGVMQSSSPFLFIAAAKLYYTSSWSMILLFLGWKCRTKSSEKRLQMHPSSI